MPFQKLIALFLSVAAHLVLLEGFNVIPNKSRVQAAPKSSSQLHATSNDKSIDRRYLISSILASSAIFKSDPSNAVDPLFKANPLTNPILEKVNFQCLSITISKYVVLFVSPGETDAHN